MAWYARFGSTFVLFDEQQNVHAVNSVDGPRACCVVVDYMNPSDLNDTLVRTLRLQPAQIWTPDEYVVMGAGEVTDSDGSWTAKQIHGARVFSQVDGSVVYDLVAKTYLHYLERTSGEALETELKALIRLIESEVQYCTRKLKGMSLQGVAAGIALVEGLRAQEGINPTLGRAGVETYVVDRQLSTREFQHPKACAVVTGASPEQICDALLKSEGHQVSSHHLQPLTQYLLLGRTPGFRPCGVVEGAPLIGRDMLRLIIRMGCTQIERETLMRFFALGDRSNWRRFAQAGAAQMTTTTQMPVIRAMRKVLDDINGQRDIGD